MKRYFIGGLLISLLVTLNSPAQSDHGNQKLKRALLQNKEVSLSLAQAAIRQPQDWPDEPVDLVVTEMAVNEKTIQELLLSNHIYPDVEAFSVIYFLNPKIVNLAKLDNISELRVPKVQGGPSLEKLFAADYVVLLTLDQTLKDQFVWSAQKVSNLTHDITIGETQCKDLANRDSVVQSLNFLSNRLNKISERVNERYGRPMPTEVISQLKGDAELLQRVLSDISSKKQICSNEQQQKINAIKQDVQLKSVNFSEAASGEAPPRWPEVMVHVKTIKSGNEVPNLRVYYVSQALMTEPSEFRTFDKLSSPSNQSLPEADYCFWASLDTSESQITGIRCGEIRMNRPAEIELTVSGKVHR